MAIVIKNVKDTLFCDERPYMVVTFVRNYNSRLAAGAVTNTKYELKYDLHLIYPECRDPKTNIFDAEVASKLFIKELPIGSNEAVNLFDLTIAEITSNKHFAICSHSGVMQDYWHVACYHSEKEWAIGVALKEIKQAINEGKIKWAD